MSNLTITRIAKKNNLTYKKCNMWGGYAAYLFEFNNADEFSAFVPLFKKCKNLFVDSNIYTYSAFVWDKKDHDSAQAVNDYKMELVDIFYKIIHDGGTADDGKQAQVDFCAIHPEYMPAFDLIYC